MWFHSSPVGRCRGRAVVAETSSTFRIAGRWCGRGDVATASAVGLPVAPEYGVEASAGSYVATIAATIKAFRRIAITQKNLLPICLPPHTPSFVARFPVYKDSTVMTICQLPTVHKHGARLRGIWLRTCTVAAVYLYPVLVSTVYCSRAITRRVATGTISI